MDIICAKCGKHFSNAEAAREHSRSCSQSSFNDSIQSKPPNNSTLSPQDIDRLMESVNKRRVYHEYMDKKKVHERKSKPKQKIVQHSLSRNQANNASSYNIHSNSTTRNSNSGCAKFFSCSIIVIIVLLIVGVIGGGVYGVAKHHGDIGNGITTAYNWVADGVVSIKDNVVDWYSSLSVNQTETPTTTLVTTQKTPTKSSTIGKVTDAIKEFVSPPTDTNDYIARFNEYRQSQGRTALVFTEDLNRIAALRLKEIQVSFSHSSKGNYNKHLAENIVMGIHSNQAALECWQGSPGHNANMLDQSYRYTGYAIGDGYAVQVFTEYETLNGEPQLPPGWFWPN